jgi:hypothetical protein
MRQDASIPTDRGQVEGRLGVIEAMRRGWAFLKGDFWPVWTVGLVAMLLMSAIGGASGIPYIGACIAVAVGIFVQPPLTAGLFLAIRRAVDGGKANVGDLFEGFRQRYWESVVALLPPQLAAGALAVVAGIGAMAMVIGASIMEGGGHGHGDEEALLAALGIGALVFVPLALAVMVFSMFFIFAALAVWDHPGRGWEAARASMRLVWANFWSVLGLMILFGLVNSAAAFLGLLACCVGMFFTVPVVMVWQTATLIYLYRSWTGQALVQAGAADASGPVAPTEILPPPPPPPPPGQGG